jgi:molybdenum cofactor synthesis domain-containing protein
MARSAAALIIGNEVLSGKVRDENGPYLVEALRRRGVELSRLYVVPDEPDAIVEALAALRPRAEVIFTSGGLGPTHDDVTVPAVARFLGRRVVRHAAMEALVRRHWGDAATPEAMRLADAPEGAVFFEAPGLWLPVLTVEELVLLPGIPRLFRMQLDAIADRFGDQPFHLRCLYLSVYEELIAGALSGVAARHPEVAIGSYPVLGEDYKVKLTIESRRPERVEAAVEELLRVLPPEAIRRLE